MLTMIAPSGQSDVVLAHLMPGKVIIRQSNSQQEFKTVMNITLNGTVEVIINRDFNKFASGTVYFDDGQLVNQPYEYYQFTMTGKSIQKINLNASFEGEGYKVERFVITNAKDMWLNDFSCFIFEDGSVF